MKASETTGRKVKVFAVEKNPYAIVTLFTLKEEVWKDKVDVIPGDMRNWKPREDQVNRFEHFDVVSTLFTNCRDHR